MRADDCDRFKYQVLSFDIDNRFSLNYFHLHSGRRRCPLPRYVNRSEDELQEIVQLVGKDSLSEDQKSAANLGGSG